MKNRTIYFKIITFIFILFISFDQSSADDVIINAEVVDIKEKGNLIIASGSVSITDGKNITIEGKEAKYNKLNQSIQIEGNVIFLDRNKNYKVSSKKIIFDRKNNIISSFENTEASLLDKSNINTILKITGKKSSFDKNKEILEINENVVLKDFINNYEIFSEKIIFSRTKQLIRSLGKTKINYEGDYFILTKDIFFNRNKNILYTKKPTTITDNLNNRFELSNLNLNLEEKIFKAKNIKLSDIENNSLELINGYVNLNSNELIGSDFTLNFNKNMFGNSENDPRLIGRYIIANNSETMMKKSSFTTCKNIDGKCPAWSISADEVIHKKEKKRIEYKNAWLEIYDVPVAYFPYFFHPDPTVKRQSGFLFPEFINSSNLGFSTQIAYFNAIDHDRDMTISPRVYTNNNLFIQTEYRQILENSNWITDFSFNKKNNSNSHFFSTLSGGVENSFYKMKIETVSNKDYLKKYQIKSPLIENYSVLNSSLSYEKHSEDYSFSSSLNIIEDLSKTRSDRYEYSMPSYMFSKETLFTNNIFDKLIFKSNGNYRKYNTNVDEMDIVNDFIFSSNNQDQVNNLEKELKFLIRNINTYGDLSSTYKEDSSYNILGSILLNFKYPLFKESKSSKQFLTPITSFRYSPYKGANLKNEQTLIRFQDLFLLDRINSITVESGASATLGLEYKNQNNINQDKIILGLAMNFRNKEDKDLPPSSSLGQKTSDLIGYSGINITENLSLNYNFSIDQNLSEANYSLVSANYNGDRFKTSFEYMEKSNFIGDESYLTNYTKLDLNKKNSLGFETSKNIDKDITNYYNLIYTYKNDCLKASVVYNKQFYQEDSINSGKNIFFKISFIPFGTVNTPALNDK